MLVIDKDKTASIDVDCQKGFSPICPDELPVPGGDTIVDELNTQAKFAKFRIGSKDVHPFNALHIATPEAPQFTPVGLPNVDIKWTRHCQSGTLGAELLDGLPHWTKYDFFVFKGIEKDSHPYGILYHTLDDKLSTGVKEFLYLKGIKYVIVGGLALDHCVKKTVLSLREAGFEVILNLAATKAIASPTDDGRTTFETAMEEMAKAGAAFINDSRELGNI